MKNGFTEKRRTRGRPTHLTYPACLTCLTQKTYQANSAFRRRTRGFMYANDVCQPTTFGTYVVL